MTIRPPLLSDPAGRPAIVLARDIALRPGRVHEGCGRSRRVLAAMVAGAVTGPVLWARPQHEVEGLMPAGLRAFFDPARLILVRARTALDLLWTLEEALRSGAVGLAVAELAQPPGLTPVRRLHLAAEAGGGRVPGLLLTPDQGGAPGVESRWHLAPEPDGGWLARRLRARMAPELRLRLVRGADGRLETERLPVDEEAVPVPGRQGAAVQRATRGMAG